MEQGRFKKITARYEELHAEQLRLGAEQDSLRYNTEGNSHHPLAFRHIDDALLHRQLERRITEIENDKRQLAFETQHEGFPENRWVKVEAPEVPDDAATGIMLRERGDEHCELITEDWSLVLAEG